MMEKLDRIAWLSGWLYRASTLLACGLPLVVLGAILGGWFDAAGLASRFPALPATLSVSQMQATAVALIAVVAVFPMVAACLAMRRLFGRYRSGEILTDHCAAEILRVGQALFAVAAMTVLVPTAQLLVLSWNAAPGGRILSIGIDGSTVGFLLSGAMLIVIGWVMREAAQAAEDNRGFV
jgi:Protein of unknown function (DUF2975)